MTKNRTKNKQKAFDSLEDKLYDEWVREMVQEALDDPSPTLSHEEVWDYVLKYTQEELNKRNKIVDTTK